MARVGDGAVLSTVDGRQPGRRRSRVRAFGLRGLVQRCLCDDDWRARSARHGRAGDASRSHEARAGLL